MADGRARSGWDIDLADGEANQSAFVAAIREAHVECKKDEILRRTGNVAFEIRQGSTEPGKGKYSGIYATTAKWWCVEYADDRWIVLRTSVARQIVAHVKEVSGTKMGGDYNKFELVLVPITMLVRPISLVDKDFQT